MRIYICDDNDLDRERVRRMLSVYAGRFKSKLKIWQFKNAKQMFTVMSEDGVPPDLVFLDIYMENMDGITAGQKLKDLSGGEIPVIFSTSSVEHAILAFQLRAAGYLHKPYTQEDFNHALGRVEQMFRDSGRYLDVWLNERESTLRIWLEDVLWLESEGRGTRFFLSCDSGYKTGGAVLSDGHRDDTLFTTSPLKTFRDRLNQNPDFYECGRSCILHLTWAEGMEEHGMCMKNGALVPVPVRLKAGAAQRLKSWKKDQSGLYIR